MRQYSAWALCSIMLLGANQTALGATHKCSFDTSRKGLESIDFYYNEENQAYLLIRFKDPRFDDTTDVVKVKGCSKISSGVTSQSNFDQKLSAAGYKREVVSSSTELNVVNSLYGELSIKSSPNRIEVLLQETEPERLRLLQAVKRMLKLEVPFQAAQYDIAKNDNLLARQPWSDFEANASASLATSTLISQWLNVAEVESASSGSLTEKHIHDVYKKNIVNQIKYGLGSNSAEYSGALDRVFSDQAKVWKLENYWNNTLEWRRKYISVFEYESPAIFDNLLNQASKSGSHDNATFLYSEVSAGQIYKNSDSARGRLDDLLVSTFARQLGLGNSDAVAKQFVRLHELGFRSAELTSVVAANFKRSASFENIAYVYDNTKNIDWVKQFQSLAKTTVDMGSLERIAVGVIAQPQRLFEISLTPSVGKGYITESKGGFLSGVDYSKTGYIPLSVSVDLTKSRKLPILKYGRYVASVKISASAPYQEYRRSRMKGNKDVTSNKTWSCVTSIAVDPPNYVGRGECKFDHLPAALFVLGVAGGHDQEGIVEDPVISVESISIRSN